MFDRVGKNMLRQTARDDRNRVKGITSIVIVNTANSVLTSAVLCFFMHFCFVLKNVCHSEQQLHQIIRCKTIVIPLIMLTNISDPAQFCDRIYTSPAVVVEVPSYLRPFCMASVPTDDS